MFGELKRVITMVHVDTPCIKQIIHISAMFKIMFTTIRHINKPFHLNVKLFIEYKQNILFEPRRVFVLLSFQI